MFCAKCGKEIDDDAVICHGCGCPTQNYNKTPVVEDKATGGMIFLSILIPLVGIILGCVNISKGLKQSGKTYLTVSLVTLAICTVLIFYLGGY